MSAIRDGEQAGSAGFADLGCYTLQDLPDLLAVAKNVADGAVGALLGLPDCLGVGMGEDVFLLDDDAAPLRQLVYAIQLHSCAPPPDAGQQ